ncbi:antitermination protein NusG (plasmid) [Erwinia tracheiphila]|uniref:Antitermination protein NusG n=1 Tax=Erwinia tracheiphila TaxID=65700 RepID=A0A345CZW8_9GAMM|nr:transcription termination/antitermination NusG family protein [Erwinia tracheiphila]AXF78985.1 antitermination protein NusG [Erwinia tracheiphila]UIA85883.1 antitermination protein NusG [Erwinia tracheiphila]UIA94404.1 antitermination protein NusG [Erwinia tracheiphila]
MLNWYLACHQPGKEALYKAQMQLSRLHINSFCPLIRLSRPRPDTSACRLIIEPLFSGYLFIEFDPDKTHTTKLTELSSISHFVRFGCDIKPMPRKVIESLMQLKLCPTEQDVIASIYKEHIMAITRVKNKHERTVMFIAFMESLNTPLRKSA